MDDFELYREKQRENARNYYIRHRDEILEKRREAYRQKNPVQKPRGPKPKDSTTE
jgi:hypothetical protein